MAYISTVGCPYLLRTAVIEKGDAALQSTWHNPRSVQVLLNVLSDLSRTLRLHEFGEVVEDGPGIAAQPFGWPISFHSAQPFGWPISIQANAKGEKKTNQATEKETEQKLRYQLKVHGG